MNHDAMDTAVLVVGCVVAACLVIGIGVALVLAPIQGNWAPDIALGFWAVIGLFVYVVYRCAK